MVMQNKTHTRFKLRPYQRIGLNAVNLAYQSGTRSMLLIAPVAAGKTAIFAALAEQYLRAGKRVLILAHRDELIDSARKHVLSLVNYHVGIVKAEQNAYQAPCVIASVQTLSRQKRLALLGKFDLIVVDEAHHATAQSYRDILAHVQHDDSLLLGVTATPNRTDKVGLSWVFEDVVYEISLLELMHEGYIAPITAKQVGLPVDFSRVRTKRDTDGTRDFDQSHLAISLEKVNWHVKVTDAWLEHAHDRSTLAFVPRVKLAHRLAKYMRKRGIAAVAVDGKTPKGERHSLLAQYEAGEIQVLINCDLLREGTDLPRTNCVVMARPTKSHLMYYQAIGRGLRLCSETGKTDLLVLDVVGATARHEFIVAADLLGESLPTGKKGKTVGGDGPEVIPFGYLRGQLQAREVNLFDPTQKITRTFQWTMDDDEHRAFLKVGEHRFAITVTKEGVFQCSQDGKHFDTYPEFDLARQACENVAAKSLRVAAIQWRNSPATAIQLQLLQRLGVKYNSGVTKAEAAKLIFDNRSRVSV